MGLSHSVKLYVAGDAIVIKFNKDHNIVLVDGDLRFGVKGLDYSSFDLIREIKTKRTNGRIEYRIYFCDGGSYIIGIAGVNTRVARHACTYDPKINTKINVFGAIAGTDEMRFGGYVREFCL